MTADGNWGPYNGNPNIDEKHRECPTVLVIGMARRGKSTLCELLTGAGVFSDEHILREPDTTHEWMAGQRNTRVDPVTGSMKSVVGDTVFENAKTSTGFLTASTSVVETQIRPEWDPEHVDGDAPAPLVLVDTPGISNVTSVMNAEEADMFMDDIMRKTLHMNSSYGGFERFIIVAKADEVGVDPNAIECIKHLAKAFGGGSSDNESEVMFMKNVSIVFTFSDRIFKERTTADRTAAINDVLARYQQSLYDNSEVARQSGVTLLHNVNHELLPGQVACYFVDSEQATTLVQPAKDSDEEQESKQDFLSTSKHRSFLFGSRFSVGNFLLRQNREF